MNDVAQGLLELAKLHTSLLVNLGGTDSGYSNAENPGVGTGQPSTFVRRPWLDMPEGGVPFDTQNSAALPAVGANVVAVTLTVPDGYDGVINAYSWNFTGGGFVDGSGDIRVLILRDGIPIRNFDNILVQKGTVGIARVVSPIRIYSKQVITILAVHVANNLLSGNVVGSLVGYFYPNRS